MIPSENDAPCEFEQRETAYRLIAYIESITHRTIDEIKAYLEQDFVDLIIHAHGMSQMIVQIDFK